MGDAKSKSPARHWFKAKTYGYGWYPATWQGWLVTVGYVVLLLPGGYFFFDSTVTAGDGRRSLGFILYALVLTIGLIAICAKTGEKPRWRWGAYDEE
jgi:hypothetical protein